LFFVLALATPCSTKYWKFTWEDKSRDVLTGTDEAFQLAHPDIPLPKLFHFWAERWVFLGETALKLFMWHHLAVGFLSEFESWFLIMRKLLNFWSPQSSSA
jgi:hypothetical protein